MKIKRHGSTSIMYDYSHDASGSHPIIGKTITGVIARPGSDGREIVMLQFDDGTCFEVLSPRSQRTLTRLAKDRRRGRPASRQAPLPPAAEDAGREPAALELATRDGLGQLSFFA